MSSLIFDLLLCGVADLFTNNPRKAQRRAFKTKTEIKLPGKKSSDTSMEYIILDDLNRNTSRDLKYQDPPETFNHYDDGGPDW